MKIEIRRWDNNEIIVYGEYESIKDCLEKNNNKSFYRANLSSADLSSADLRYANLSYANLSYADLRSANLRSANLSSADLSSANLSYANLSSANLSSADLRYANLSYANLSSPNLSYANLSSANLRSADLRKMPQLNTPTINEYIKEFNIKKEGEYIYVFKGVNDNLENPQSDVKIKYDIGVKSVEYADCDVWKDCSFGISLSPTIKAAKEWGSKIVSVKVNIGDISCIPIYDNEKKFRVKKCEVMGEILEE